MKRIIAGSATIALACLWASSVGMLVGVVVPARVAAAAAVPVEFTVARKDIESYWKKNYSA